MCGIAGHYSEALDQQAGLNHCEKMTLALSHRGPDDSGLWSSGNGWFIGHRRLSILDLSELGHQPMVFANHVLSYNGELYNHLSVRRELEEKGHQFQGQSDSETLLHALVEWGIESALKRFDGMFAFALYDIAGQTLTIARDRIGEKPLYYGQQDKQVYFASEPKALMALPGFERRLNLPAVAGLMKYAYVPSPHCILEGVKKLPAGHYCTIKRGGSWSAPRPYWTHPTPSRSSQVSMEQAIEQVERRLVQVVQQQTLSDVPVGTFLSGGVDSTVITALLQAHSDRPVSSFSIGFEEPQYDESAVARKIAGHLGTDHTTMMVSARDVLGMVDHLASTFCEPFADSSQLPTMLLSKLTKEKVTVILSGDGGDELFGGYNRHIYLNQLLQRTQAWPRSMRRLLGQTLTLFSEEAWDQTFHRLQSVLPKKVHQAQFGHKIHKLASILADSSPLEIYDHLISQWDPVDLLGQAAPSGLTVSSGSAVEQVMVLDTLNYLPDDIMVKVDRSSMAVSLETRAPFLDHQLIELVNALPLHYKIQGDQGKVLLRKILAKYVPSEWMDRPKQGFAVPLRDWLRGELHDWAQDLVVSLKRHDWLNQEIVARRFERHMSGQQNWAYPLWTLLMFESWHRQWMEGV